MHFVETGVPICDRLHSEDELPQGVCLSGDPISAIGVGELVRFALRVGFEQVARRSEEDGLPAGPDVLPRLLVSGSPLARLRKADRHVHADGDGIRDACDCVFDRGRHECSVEVAFVEHNNDPTSLPNISPGHLHRGQVTVAAFVRSNATESAVIAIAIVVGVTVMMMLVVVVAWWASCPSR
jgi:hypothetical protein